MAQMFRLQERDLELKIDVGALRLGHRMNSSLPFLPGRPCPGREKMKFFHIFERFGFPDP